MYRENYLESRERCLAAFGPKEASEYDAWVAVLTRQDHEACLADLSNCVSLVADTNVLDAGAGTGALCHALTLVPGLRVTALEPCPAMRSILNAKPDLSHIETVAGFCDHPSDRDLFEDGQFDVIASRQLTNCLYDPLAAFRNWHAWLQPLGTVVVMDGLFDRSAWSGIWDGVVDTLPLSACRTMATVPYLMEQCGFRVTFAGFMEVTNTLPSTRTMRYMVAAKKCDG
ncbi:hypothetical protein Poly51_30640 [Rubripirellula tenax]|uniref:Methyltransferase type 11 domain-containing protein n=1 Tax=Rubripirellula tenax TaxID=2528015 RepID=A0A5C6F1T8_9BACT|nr:class I SAM-dependent methyltransferase [Rubripirellula tenax]TWU54347.1 hypothetical protein Poly51_30640 [Rubripirellula tenax]